MDLTNELERLLKEKLNPQKLTVYNDSNLHAGHREAGEAVNSHFRVEISNNFSSGTRIEKHRAIIDAISEYIDNPIHAIEIKLI